MKNLRRFLALTVIAVLTGLLLNALTIALSQPKYESELVFVTPSRGDLLAPVKKEFEAYAQKVLGTRITMKFIRAGSPICMDRIIAWGGHPDADIFFGGEIIYHWELKKRGLLMPYHPKGEEKVPDMFLGAPLKDPEGYWHPKLFWGHGFVYNLKVLEALGLRPPKTWEDLLDPKYKGLIVMCTPSRSSSTHINVEVILQRLGWEKGWGFWRRLAYNIGRFVPRSHDVHELVDKGEYAVGFGYHLAAVMDKAKGYPIDMYLDPTGFIFSGVSILKGAPHPNAAKAFLDFWYTEEIQSKVINVGGIPVLPTVKVEGAPGTPAGILRSYLHADNIYEAVKKFKVPPYNFTLAMSRFKEVNRIFDETIVNKHGELVASWDGVLSANSTIAEVKAKLTSLVKKGYDVSKAEKILAEAEDLLKQAITAFEAGKYSEAASLANKAKGKANEALSLLSKLSEIVNVSTSLAL